MDGMVVAMGVPLADMSTPLADVGAPLAEKNSWKQPSLSVE